MIKRIVGALFAVIIISTLLMGCAEKAKNIAKGETEVIGKIESFSEPPVYTYNYIIGTVVNGPANVGSFNFKLTDDQGSTVLSGKVDHYSVEGTIQFVNYGGSADEADTGDVFTLVTYQNCTGGNLRVSYGGNVVDNDTL